MQNFFDALDGKVSIWKKIAKHDISSTELALRLHYIFNSSFQIRVPRSNQYFLRQNQFTIVDRVNLNKF